MSKPFSPKSLRLTLFLAILLALPQSTLASITSWTGSAPTLRYEFDGVPETRDFYGRFDVDTDSDVVVDFFFQVIRDFGRPTVRTYNYSPSNGSFASLTGDDLFVVNNSGANSLDFHLPGADFFSPISVEAFGNFAETRGSESYFWSDAEFFGTVQTTPIPELEIYAMLGLGLGLMGWAGRRRNLKAA